MVSSDLISPGLLVIPVSSSQPVQLSNPRDQRSMSSCQYYGAGTLPSTTFWGWQVNLGH